MRFSTAGNRSYIPKRDSLQCQKYKGMSFPSFWSPGMAKECLRLGEGESIQDLEFHDREHRTSLSKPSLPPMTINPPNPKP